jgi:hypothetical protein
MESYLKAISNYQSCVGSFLYLELNLLVRKRAKVDKGVPNKGGKVLEHLDFHEMSCGWY